MHQRKKEKEELTQWAGDKLSDPEDTLPNFPDWDNPEDFDDDAPEGYYDEDEEDDDAEDDDSYVPDEEDPDFDLSEAAGYAGYDSEGSVSPVPSWMITAFAVIVILGIVLGTFAALTR